MAKEIERRFLITSLSPNFPKNIEKHLILQAYVDVANDFDNFRVRITDREIAEITFKEGWGILREEDTHPIPLETGIKLYQKAKYKLRKERHKFQGWEIDFFWDNLSGAIFAEIELESEDEPCALPAWIGEGIEVTNTLNNMHLARIAALMAQEDQSRVLDFILRRVGKKIPTVVFTGGPCSGKSTACEELEKEFPHIKFVPEVATVLMDNFKVAPPPKGNNNVFQKAVYGIQQVLEATSMEESIEDRKKAIVFDRGCVDSATYLKGGNTHYEELFRTSIKDEYMKYDLVLCFEVPPEDIYNRFKGNNPKRRENYLEAETLGRRIFEVWKNHPKCFRVLNNPPDDWGKKLNRVRNLLSSHL